MPRRARARCCRPTGPATEWNLLARVSRHGSATRVFNFGGGFEPKQTYGAEWQLDAEVEYRITPKWSVALGGQNLTDEYPDRSIDGYRLFRQPAL